VSRHRLLLASLCAVVTASGLAGCDRGGSPTPRTSTVVAPSLDALSDAIELVNQGRATVLERTRKVTAGLERRDAVDVLATAGNRSAVGQADPGADAAMLQALGALRDLGVALAAYQKGIDDLGRAATSPELTPEQRRPLGTVIATARAEISSTRQVAAVVRAAVPAYDALARHLDEWLRRAKAGWYRDQTESANAYTVLVGGTRQVIEVARARIAAADRARTAAAQQTVAALSAARTALSPLTTRPTEVPITPSELGG
jgi:hypothetical protein